MQNHWKDIQVSNGYSISPSKNSYFGLYAQGKHFTTLVPKIKTRPGYKPWFPPDRASAQLSIEEEKKRGEAGDPLLIGQMDAQCKMVMHPKEEYRLWMEVKETNANGQEVIVKKPYDVGATANSLMRVVAKQSGFLAIYNINLQQRYELMQELATGYIPPTKEQAKELIQEKIKTEDKQLDPRVIEDWTLKTIDNFNLYFLGIHQNLAGTWNTVSHLPNLEHREFYRVLDDEKLKCQLEVTCYQKQWHTEKGNFLGEKYVSLLWCILLVFI